MKKVHGGILICDVLFVTAAIFTSAVDVFLGIEMPDAGNHRVKIANLCRFCGKTAFSKKTSARLKEKFKLEFQQPGINVEDDNDSIHHPNVCLTCVRYFYCLRGPPSSHAIGKIPIPWEPHKDDECMCVKDGRGRPSMKKIIVDVEDGSDTESGEDDEDEAEKDSCNMFRNISENLHLPDKD